MPFTPESASKYGKLGARKKGFKLPRTRQKEAVALHVQQRVFGIMNSLINAQVSLAKGTQMLYRIDTDAKGKRSKPVLVTDKEEIAEYLDGEFGTGNSLNTEDRYYYITAQLPNNQALDSLLDRAIGKPTESLDVTSGGHTIIAVPTELMHKNDKTDTSTK